MNPEIDKDGNKRWYKNGELHRDDGPAIEWANGSKGWYKNGLLHRDDGPAIEGADGTKEWWVDGKQYTEKKFDALKNPCEIMVNGKKYKLVPV